jgi:hypothetical protein
MTYGDAGGHLALKYGADIELDELLRRITIDCPWRNPKALHQDGCKAFYIDLEPPPRRPDLPPSMRLRVVQGGKL